MLETYAIQIQMYSDLKETRKLKVPMTRRTMPRLTSVGDLCCIDAGEERYSSPTDHGRDPGMWREDVDDGELVSFVSNRASADVPEAYDKASTDLFESFRQYDESGSPQRIQVLKYLVLTSMLMGSEINPFDSQETKPSV